MSVLLLHCIIYDCVTTCLCAQLELDYLNSLHMILIPLTSTSRVTQSLCTIQLLSRIETGYIKLKHLLYIGSFIHTSKVAVCPKLFAATIKTSV